MSGVPLVQQAYQYGSAVAVTDRSRQCGYQELLDRSAQLAGKLLDAREDLGEARVACLVAPSVDYVVAQWAIWRAGGVFVPLSLSAAPPELEYTLTDSRTECVIASSNFADKLGPLCTELGVRMVLVEDLNAADVKPLPEVGPERRAMILYTSGTTSRPKGVVTTHANIEAQIRSLVAAWKWRSDDRIPCFLPLHHIHGIINILSCALWSGAQVEMFNGFQMESVLQQVAARAYTVFMAVPTIYVKLIQYLESVSAAERQPILDGFADMRLMVSGSAALPASVHEKWSELTSQKLLERYGMTEIGMGLSNPYEGERRPGAVGLPLPGVDVRLMAEDGSVVSTESEPGEIQVCGPGVFREYWDRPDVTEAAFEEGWFRTGDVALLEQGYYRIMGRQSVDIIKSGGYKLSALEIEAVLLDHSSIRECAVVGVPDETWGEVVSAAVVLEPGQSLELDSLRQWCQDRLSHYRIPRRLQVVQSLPRNAMGKVTKPAVEQLFRADEEG